MGSDARSVLMLGAAVALHHAGGASVGALTSVFALPIVVGMVAARMKPVGTGCSQSS